MNAVAALAAGMHFGNNWGQLQVDVLYGFALILISFEQGAGKLVVPGLYCAPPVSCVSLLN